jgi:hypothetical protein
MGHSVKEMLDISPTVPRGTVFIGFSECGHEWVAVLGPSAVWYLRVPECVSRSEVGLKVVTLCMMIERIRE